MDGFSVTVVPIACPLSVAPASAPAAPIVAAVAAPAPIAFLAVSTPRAGSSAWVAAAEALTVAAEAGTGARWAVFPGPGDVDRERTSSQFLAVEQVHCILSLLRTAHLDKCKSAGTSRELVEHQVDAHDCTCLAEVALEIALKCLKRQVAHEKPAVVFHSCYRALRRPTGWGGNLPRADLLDFPAVSPEMAVT